MTHPHVLLVGFKGCGKDTGAQALVRELGYTQFSFADSLKDFCASMFCWPREWLNGVTPEHREWRETVDAWWAEKLGKPEFSPRYAMQNLGTNVIRNAFHDNIWVLNTQKRITETKGPVVLSDGRFPNEIRMVKEMGGKIIRVKRGPEPEWYKVALEANQGNLGAQKLIDEVYKIHPSEYKWIGQEMDYVIENNGTVGQFHDQVLQIFL